MTDQIKVSEVSAILREQLEGINTTIHLEEVGTVLQVSDGVARIYGLDNAEANELLQFDNGMEAIVMNLEEDNVGAVLLGPTDQVKEGDTVKRTRRIASINVSREHDRSCNRPAGQPDRRQRRDCRKEMPDAAGTKSSGCHFPPTGKRTVTDRYQSGGCHDPYRTRAT